MYRYIKNNNNITKCFCISCIFIYFLDSFTNFFFSTTCLINFNLVITQHQFYRLFTAPLIHANIIHLSSNLLLLFLFTLKLKSLFPTPNFFLLYALSALYGSLYSVAFTQHTSVGASGIVYGLYSAFLLTLPITYPFSNYHNITRSCFFICIGTFSLISGFFLPSVDAFAHLGGFLFGSFITLSSVYPFLFPSKLRYLYLTAITLAPTLGIIYHLI